MAVGECPACGARMRSSGELRAVTRLGDGRWSGTARCSVCNTELQIRSTSRRLAEVGIGVSEAVSAWSDSWDGEGWADAG
jgi:transcription elongation factor Elf1